MVILINIAKNWKVFGGRMDKNNKKVKTFPL